MRRSEMKLWKVIQSITEKVGVRKSKRRDENELENWDHLTCLQGKGGKLNDFTV